MDWDEYEDSPWLWVGIALLFLVMVGFGFYLASSRTQEEGMSPEEQSQVKVLRLNKKGLKALRSGNYEESIRIFRKSLKFDQGVFVSRYNLAFAQYRLGDFEPALQHVNKAIRIRTDSSKAHHLKGLILKKQGRLRTAIESFQRALEINPDKEISYFHLGKSYQRLGRYKEAEESFERGIDLTPLSQIEPQVFAHLAGAYFQTQEFGKALTNFDRAIKYSSGVPHDYHLRRAYLNFGLRNYEKTGEDVRRFLEDNRDLSANHVYALILGYLADRFRNSNKSANFLNEYSIDERMNDWPGPIIDYLRSNLSEQKLLEKTNSRGQRTEARYYMCMKNHLEEQYNQARSSCSWVVENGRDEYYEYHLAGLYLDQQTED